jgi:adenosylcobinamide-GDP ribazoletransferase
MFSAIPCPYRPWDEKARRLMLVFLPLVGLLIGLIWYGLYLLLCRTGPPATGGTGIPLPLQAAALALYPYLITGFIHLDGYMDTSDALLSRRPLEEKLRILKDPHTGAFAVISLAGLFVICYASMSAVVEKVSAAHGLSAASGGVMTVLIFVPVITRCCSSIAVLMGKPLAHSQYNEEPEAKKPAAEVAVICLIGLAAIYAALAAATGSASLRTETLAAYSAAYSVAMVLGITLIAYLVMIIDAARQLRGVSGDLAGYALTVGESVAIVMLAMLTH